MASGISSKIVEIRNENIKRCMGDTIAHRQQYIDTVDAVIYYDDSKAENVTATWFTFENIVRPVIWIAGGDDSEANLKELRRMARNKVKALVCIGTNKAKMKKTFQREVKDIFEADSLEEAVRMASLLAKDDDIVLFSPAAKADGISFAERGELFTDTVKLLENELHQ
jgi:UDP-N-acetylmuramoylalanine--D-glutamate ligase